MNQLELEAECIILSALDTLREALENGKDEDILDETHFLVLFHLNQKAYREVVNMTNFKVEEKWNMERMEVLPTWSAVSHIYDLVEEVQKLEADKDLPDLREDLTWLDSAKAENKATRFLNWLTKNGSAMSRIRLQLNEDKNSYEIWTVEPLEKDMDVFVVDTKVLITTDFVKNTKNILPMDEQPPEKRLSRMVEDQTDRIRLALFIVHEKYFMDKKSFWKPYWDVLPRLSSYLEHCTYTRADMELLKDSRPAFRVAWNEVKKILMEYIFIRNYMLRKSVKTIRFYKELRKVITFRRYLWARVALGVSMQLHLERHLPHEQSYNKILGVVEITRINQIVPTFEMIPLQGEYIPNAIFGKSKDYRWFFCRAAENLPAELRITRLVINPSTASYFKDYGWVPKSFPIQAEMYTLEIGLSRSDKLYDRKKEVLKKLNILNPGFYWVKPDLFTCDIETKINLVTFESIFAFIRVIQADEDLLDDIDLENPEFLKEPTRDSWTYLSNRFKLLATGAERTVQNILRKLNIEKDEISKMRNKKHQAIVQYLIAEQAILNCLAETTEKLIDQIQSASWCQIVVDNLPI